MEESLQTRLPVQLRRRDLAGFHHWLYVTRGYTLGILVPLWAVWTVAATVLLDGTGPGFAYHLLARIVDSALVVAVAYPLLLLIASRRCYRRLIEPGFIAIAAEGIRDESEPHLVPWRAISEIAETRSLFILEYGSSARRRWFVVPKRIFATEARAQAFLRYAEYQRTACKSERTELPSALFEEAG